MSKVQVGSSGGGGIPGGPAGGDLAGSTYPNPIIATGAISGSKIAAGAILAGDLATNIISNVDLMSGAISGSAIAANSILLGDYASNSINNSILMSATISGSVIAANSILLGDYALNSINNSILMSASVSGNAIATQSIAQGHVLNGYLDLTSNFGIISGACTTSGKETFLSGLSLGLGLTGGPTYGQTVLANGSGVATSPAVVNMINPFIVLTNGYAGVFTNLGTPYVAGKIPTGNGFYIRSTNASDSSTINWIVFNS